MCVLPCQLAQSHHFFVGNIPDVNLERDGSQREQRSHKGRQMLAIQGQTLQFLETHKQFNDGLIFVLHSHIVLKYIPCQKRAPGDVHTVKTCLCSSQSPSHRGPRQIWRCLRCLEAQSQLNYSLGKCEKL